MLETYAVYLQFKLISNCCELIYTVDKREVLKAATVFMIITILCFCYSGRVMRDA